MERLTYRTENGLICLNNDCKLSNPLLFAMEKLAEFEDFIEEQGFESLEELEHLIGYPVFKDGYDEQGNEINKIEFATYKKSFEEVFDKNKKLKQENQAFKDRWDALKKFIDTFKEHNIDEANLAWKILAKMEELEK
jgi:hypothetical protein